MHLGPWPHTGAGSTSTTTSLASVPGCEAKKTLKHMRFPCRSSLQRLFSELSLGASRVAMRRSVKRNGKTSQQEEPESICAHGHPKIFFGFGASDDHVLQGFVVPYWTLLGNSYP